MAKKKKKKPSLLKKLLFSILFITLLGVAAATVGGFIYINDMVSDLPSPEEMLSHETSIASVVYDRNGKVITKLFLENRTPVILREISPWMVKSTLAAEDSSFYKHPGIKISAIIRALYIDIMHQDIKQGGSTITQQLARTLFLTNEQTIERKIKELVIALRLEQMFSKDRILEMYLNTIYFGHGTWGIDTASHNYFGKPPSELDLAEASMIAGLIAAPERYSPLKHPEMGKIRQKYVLDRLESLGWITPEQSESAYEEKLVLKTRKTGNTNYNLAPYFVSEILFSHLLPEYGKEKVYRGGLQIHTTIDLDLQKKAKDSLNTLETEGALVSFDPSTGEVLAMTGGKDFKNSKFNRAVQAYRQPGSAFKPFVYSAAYESGILPIDHILDAPISFDHQGPDDKVWAPGNYSGEFRGEVTILEALSHSYNTVAVRTAQMTGIESVISLARKTGLTSPHIPHDLSASLGSASITPIELARAYCSFANNGYRVKPLFITRIEDGSGMILEKDEPELKRAIPDDTAVVIRSMLMNVVRAGTGVRCRIPGYEVFGKTGTTNEFRDAWFAGGVPGLVTVVYAGRDDHKTIGPKATGGKIAGPVWKSFMDYAVEKLPLKKTFTTPPGLDLGKISICTKTGYLAMPECPSAEVYLPVSQTPGSFCPEHGGNLYAAEQDTNSPRLLLLPDDVPLYKALASKSEYGQPESPFAELGPTSEQVTVPPTTGTGSDPYVDDPSPAEDIEQRYKNLLKEYGISD